MIGSKISAICVVLVVMGLCTAVALWLRVRESLLGAVCGYVIAYLIGSFFSPIVVKLWYYKGE